MSYHNNFLNTIHGTTGPCCRRRSYPFNNFLHFFDIEENNGNTIANKDNEYIISLDVPGVSKENLEIKVHDRTLSVKTHYEDQDNDTSEQRRYKYSIQIPEDVEAEKIDIVLNQGVLTITMPKSEKAQPKLLDIKEVA